MTDNGNSNTFTLASILLGLMEAKLAKLNKRAARLALAPVVAIVDNVRTVRCDYASPGAYWPEGADHPHRDLIDVTLLGDAPVIDGFKFIASIDCRGETPIVRRNPGDDTGVDLSEFYTASPDRCDHCNAKRRRNDVLILRDTSTGKLIQIGRNCAADFFRSKDAVAMVRVYALYATLRDEDSYDMDKATSVREETYVNLFRLLEMTSAVVRKFGWVSSKMVWDNEDGLVKTADRVMTSLFWRRETRADLLATTTPKDTALASYVVAWLNREFVAIPKADRNEFQHNVCGSIEDGMVRTRNFGYIVWAINGYNVHLDKLARAERTKVSAALSAHIGSVGDRCTFTARCEAVRRFEGYYGPRDMCRFADADGNVIVWWATTEPRLTVGNTYDFKATIKKHDTFNGVAQTVVSRAWLENEDPYEDD